jgi:hypothetical protein
MDEEEESDEDETGGRDGDDDSEEDNEDDEEDEDEEDEDEEDEDEEDEDEEDEEQVVPVLRFGPPKGRQVKSDHLVEGNISFRFCYLIYLSLFLGINHSARNASVTSYSRDRRDHSVEGNIFI